MNRLIDVLNALCRTLMRVAAVAGAAMGGFVALSAIMRYVLGSPYRFTEELVGLLFAAMVFLTLPYCASMSRHIRVTLVRDLQPGWARAASDIVAALAIIVFAVIFAHLSWDFTALSYRLRSVTDMAGLLVYPWMALMPIGIGLLGVVVTVRTLSALFARRIPEDQDGAPPV